MNDRNTRKRVIEAITRVTVADWQAAEHVAPSVKQRWMAALSGQARRIVAELRREGFKIVKKRRTCK